MEAVQVRKAGFPIRVYYKEFFNRFRNLLENNGEQYEEDFKSATRDVIKQLKPELQSLAVFGNAKILMKDEAKVGLEQILYQIYENQF